MNKFYSYILPLVILILFFGISTFVNNEFILYIGWIISLIWLNRVASIFQNKVLNILTIILLVTTIGWTGALLFWASAW